MGEGGEGGEPGPHGPDQAQGRRPIYKYSFLKLLTILEIFWSNSSFTICWPIVWTPANQTTDWYLIHLRKIFSNSIQSSWLYLTKHGINGIILTQPTLLVKKPVCNANHSAHLLLISLWIRGRDSLSDIVTRTWQFVYLYCDTNIEIQYSTVRSILYKL